MAKKHKTTVKDFELFKKECEYWIDKFSLRDWCVWYVHEDSDELPDALAWRGAKILGRVATIGLCVNWDDTSPERFHICKSAFHEVCELLLADVYGVAQLDICPSDKDDLESYMHSVIRRLEHAVFGPDYSARAGSK